MHRLRDKKVPIYNLGYPPEVLRPGQPALLLSLRLPLSLGCCEHRYETLQWPAGMMIEATEKVLGGGHHITAAYSSGWRCVRLLYSGYTEIQRHCHSCFQDVLHMSKSTRTMFSSDFGHGRQRAALMSSQLYICIQGLPKWSRIV